MNVINFIIPTGFFYRTGGLQNQVKCTAAELEKLGWQVTYNRTDILLNHIFGMYDENVIFANNLNSTYHKFIFSPVFQESNSIYSKVKYQIPKSKWADRKKLIKKSEVIVALGNKERTSISDIFRHENIEIIPNGIHSQKTRRKVNNKKNKIIQVGVLNNRKNPNYTIKIARALNIEVDFIGRIEKDVNLLDYKKANFYGEITNRNKLLSLVSEASVLVCPSKSEGYPLVILEALSEGTPVIVTANSNVDPCGKILHVLPLDQFDKWCLTVKDLIKQDTKFDDYENFLSSFHWSSVASRLNEIYARYA